MNEKFEEYIKDLSPELQEKARQCKTKQELLELAADEDMEIPMDVLEDVAGGCGSEDKSSTDSNVFKGECPDCGGDLVFVKSDFNVYGLIGCVIISKCEKSGQMYCRKSDWNYWKKC